MLYGEVLKHFQTLSYIYPSRHIVASVVPIASLMASGGSSSSVPKFDVIRNKVSAARPQETTRLLLDSARIARETETIGLMTKF